MHILQGDYSDLFRTHQKSLRRKQRLSKEWKEDCQDEAMGSAHDKEAVEDCARNNFNSTMLFILFRSRLK